MSSTSNYSFTSTPCMPGRNVQFTNAHVCEDAEVEGNLQVNTVNHLPYPPGGGFLPAPVANKILRTNNLSVVSWGDVNPSNLTGGAVGDVLKTIAPGTVAWDPVKPSDLTPGTANQILHTKSDGSAAEWTSSLEIPSNLVVDGSTTLQSNVVCDQTLSVTGNTFCDSSLTVTNDIGVSNGNLDVFSGLTTLQALTLNGNMIINGVNGTTGQVIQKTGATTQSWVTPSYPPSVITPGSSNQVFVTDSLGTTAQWSNNLALPGTLSVTSTTNLAGDLQLNGVSGSSGQYLKKTSGSTQAFANIAAADITAGVNNTILTSLTGTAQWITPLQIKNIIYGTTFSAQDLNAAAGPTTVSFSTTPIVSVNTSNTTAVTGITQPSATQFVINDTSLYQVQITGYIDPASAGLGNSIITLSAEVGGVEQSTSCIVCNGDYSFSGTISGLTISASQVLRILVRRVVGTSNLTTFASGSAAPTFASTIIIRNMS